MPLLLESPGRLRPLDAIDHGDDSDDGTVIKRPSNPRLMFIEAEACVDS